MRKILGLLVPVIALAGGIAGGEMLRSGAGAADPAAAESQPDDQADGHGTKETDAHASPDKPQGGDHDSGAVPADGWFTFPRQFFVPLMRNGDMGAVMILTLTIETPGADLAAMEQQEHRLRDALLRELLIHANTGGFDGNFTSEARLAPLRERLQKAAQASTDLTVKAVLIEDIARQAG